MLLQKNLGKCACSSSSRSRGAREIKVIVSGAARHQATAATATTIPQKTEKIYEKIKDTGVHSKHNTHTLAHTHR